MSIFDVPIGALDGGPADLQQYRGKALLVVNVASKCGLTPQYASLQRLYETYTGRGLVVLGVPCNQFGMQEPGTATQIRDFCEANFGITFPITEKVEVNGAGRHELFARLTEVADADGVAGDVRWNFEKFLIRPDGSVGARFRPLTDPLAPELIAAVEEQLPLVAAEVPAATPAPAVEVNWGSLAEARWPHLRVAPPQPAAELREPDEEPQVQIVQPSRSGSRWRRIWSS